MQHLYEIDVRVPMRDGVALAANVWHPADGEAPTLLVRLPYGKGAMGFGQSAIPTGGVIAHEREEQMIPAINHIHHGPNRPSRLVLPIIDRKGRR
jgi:predicted acyl esterase